MCVVVLRDILEALKVYAVKVVKEGIKNQRYTRKAIVVMSEWMENIRGIKYK